ncbi:hypothetical protein NC651_015867 [Populus alba x Populus x berolinensis]|nr:hypothetical protein NC651_015867 [Populus alba x Populus x berolinensis]
MKRDQMPQKKNSLIKLSSKEDAQGKVIRDKIAKKMCICVQDCPPPCFWRTFGLVWSRKKG